MRTHLENSAPYRAVDILLFQHGVNSAGIAEPNQWLTLARRHAPDARLLALDPRRSPHDIASLGRYARQFKAMPPARKAWSPLGVERTIQAVGQYARGVFTDAEFRVIRPDGTVRWVRNRAFPIRDENGNLSRIAGLAEDITQRLAAIGHVKIVRWHTRVPMVDPGRVTDAMVATPQLSGVASSSLSSSGSFRIQVPGRM